MSTSTTEIVERSANAGLASLDDLSFGTADLLLKTGVMERLERFALAMSKSAVTIPEHLRGKPADCLAVAMQATQWGMNPFPVAQKTFIALGGKLGYEAQLVATVINQHAPLARRLEYEFFGPWEKVIGRHVIKTSEKTNKLYAAIGWSDKDEVGIGVRVIGHIRGEEKPRSIEVLLQQCYPRNSTLWATDPQQQIVYASTQKWARRYYPDVILGVYSEADFFPAGGHSGPAPVERDMGVIEPDKPAPVSRTDKLKEKVKARNAAPADTPPPEDSEPVAEYEALLAKIKAASDMDELKELKNAARALHSSLSSGRKSALTQALTAQFTVINEPKPLPPEDDGPVVTFAEVAGLLNSAGSRDELDEACDLIGSVANETHRAELMAIYDKRLPGIGD